MRDVTERPEGIAAGVVKLVGTESQRSFRPSQSCSMTLKRMPKCSVRSTPMGMAKQAFGLSMHCVECLFESRAAVGCCLSCGWRGPRIGGIPRRPSVKASGHMAAQYGTGTRDFGSYTFAVTVATIVAAFGPIGVDRGAVYFGARYRQSKSWSKLRGLLQSTLVISMCSAVVCAISLHLCGPMISQADAGAISIAALGAGFWIPYSPSPVSCGPTKT